jgi:hypothetical protein
VFDGSDVGVGGGFGLRQEDTWCQEECGGLCEEGAAGGGHCGSKTLGGRVSRGENKSGWTVRHAG